MWLIAGLGNPGAQYETSRHNIGFMVLDNLADTLNEKFKKSPFNGLACKTLIDRKPVVLLKPTTYMNESGFAIRACMDWYGIEPHQLIVVYDDMDLELGRLRIREKGSAGGHNGMKSIIAHTGTSDFPRVRIGIGKPKHEDKTISHVLSSFKGEELKIVSESVLMGVDAAREIIVNGITEAQNKFNTQKTSCLE